MSLQSPFSVRDGHPRRSRSMTRHLKLLEAILKFFLGPATEIHDQAKKHSDEREFWTEFLTPCSRMELTEWQWDLLDNSHDRLVLLILQRLEGLLNIDESDIEEVSFVSSKSPRSRSSNGVIGRIADLYSSTNWRLFEC